MEDGSLDRSQEILPPRASGEESRVRIGRWQPSNLTLRVATAVVLLPPVLWLLYRGGLWVVGLVIAINLISVNEFYGFIEQKGARPQRLLGGIAVAVIPLVVYFGDAFLGNSFLTAVLLATMLRQLTKQQIQEAIASVSATFFGIFYIGWLMSHTVSIRLFGQQLLERYPAAAGDVPADVGFFFIVFACVSTIGCDIGAYFTGRRFGRHKLAPTISPNKTVEGVLGGLVSGALLGIAVKLFFEFVWPEPLSAGFPWTFAALFGLLISAAGVLGDLIESVLKRDAQVKDAGWVLPGVGGMLDRIDSILLAFPVLYYLLVAYYQVRFGS